MAAFLGQFHPIMQALLGTLFTWFVTALGSTPVFFAKRINRQVLDTMLGLAAGVMVASALEAADELARRGVARCPRCRKIHRCRVN